MDGTRNCKIPSHSLYVYVIMLFCKGDNKFDRSISHLLKRYAECPGQVCNPNKFIIYVRDMNQDMHIYLASILGYEKAHPPFIYLSVPIFRGNLKFKHLNFLADSIKHKFSSEIYSIYLKMDIKLLVEW